MAYRTDWKLSAYYFYDMNKDIYKLSRKEIEEYIEENEDMRWVFGEGLFEWGEGDRSFRDSDENMYKLSNQFPDFVFVLDYSMMSDSGIAENREYWFKGEVQRETVKIVIDDFDVNKLKHVCE